jgi:hypothetical protein
MTLTAIGTLGFLTGAQHQSRQRKPSIVTPHRSHSRSRWPGLTCGI